MALSAPRFKSHVRTHRIKLRNEKYWEFHIKTRWARYLESKSLRFARLGKTGWSFWGRRLGRGVVLWSEEFRFVLCFGNRSRLRSCLGFGRCRMVRGSSVGEWEVERMLFGVRVRFGNRWLFPRRVRSYIKLRLLECLWSFYLGIIQKGDWCRKQSISECCHFWFHCTFQINRMWIAWVSHLDRFELDEDFLMWWFCKTACFKHLHFRLIVRRFYFDWIKLLHL